MGSIGGGDRRVIVCLCHGFTGRHLRQAREAGVDRVAEVFRFFEAPPQCGKCANCMLDILRHRDCFPWDHYTPPTERTTFR